MSAYRSSGPWGAAPVSAEKDLPTRGQRWLSVLTFAFLISGAALHLVNIHVDSVVISHTSRSAMIFGLVGLRRGVQQDAATMAAAHGETTA